MLCKECPIQGPKKNWHMSRDTRRTMERFFLLSDPTNKPLWNVNINRGNGYDSCHLFVFVWSFKNYHCCRVAKFILLRFINCHPLTCRYSTVELTVYLHQSQNRHLLFASCQLPMFIYLVTNETNKLCICCTMLIVDEPSYTFLKWSQCILEFQSKFSTWIIKTFWWL